MEAEVRLAMLTARWRRERMSPFLTQPSAALVFSLSFTLSSESTGSHLTHFILFTKGVGPGLVVTPAATMVPFASSASVPGTGALPLFLVYALRFCFRLITNGTEKGKTRLKGFLARDHSHIL